jgi:hypothetical protein
LRGAVDADSGAGAGQRSTSCADVNRQFFPALFSQQGAAGSCLQVYRRPASPDTLPAQVGFRAAVPHHSRKHCYCLQCQNRSPAGYMSPHVHEGACALSTLPLSSSSHT